MNLFNSDCLFWNLEPLGIGMENLFKFYKIHFMLCVYLKSNDI